MNFELTNKYNYLTQDNIIKSIILIVAVICSLCISVFSDISDTKGVGLMVVWLIAPILLYIVSTNRSTWVPVIFLLMAVRNLNLVSFLGFGGLKVGDLFIGYIFFIWLLNNSFANNPVKFIKSRLDMFIVMFVVFYAFSLLWTDDISLGLLRVTKFIRNYIFYILIRELFTEDFIGNYKKLSLSYIITGLTMAVVYVLFVFKGVGLEDIYELQQKEVLTSQSLGFIREKGTGVALLSNGPAGFLVVSGLFTFGFLMFKNGRFFQFIKIAISMTILFIGTVVLMHRSIILLVATLFTVMLFGSYKAGFKEGRRALTLVIVIIGIVLCTSGIHKMIAKRFINPVNDSSWTERTELIGAAWKGFVSSPIVGVGPGGNYSLQFRYADTEPSRHVDNLYMAVLSEVGLVGFTLLIIIIFYLISYNYYFFRNSRNNYYLRNTSLLILAYCCGYFGVALIGQEFENFESWIMLGLTSAIMAIQKSINSGERGELVS